ncbi:glycosyltransferase family 4 protein [Phormidium tenue FACHB-886]|nr:glycosyltransferase family 4 protein [Phormidium tenue FACHB-886]
MTRIALIAGTYQPQHCGVADYTARLRQQLAQHGLETIVLTTHEAAQAAADPTVHGAIDQWKLSCLAPLIRALHATQADILHIQHAAGTYRFDRSIFLLPLWLRLTGWSAPIVTTIHEYGWWEWQPPVIPPRLLEGLKTWGQRQGWWDREDGFLLTQSDAIITTNASAETVIKARLPHLKTPVYRIPIGANVDVMPIERDDRQAAQQRLKQRYGWAPEAQVIAFFGFLHPVKGLETLLPAFRQVLASHPNARLLVIGGVESLALPKEQAAQYWQKLQQLIAELGLNDTVHLTGYLQPDAVSQDLAGVELGVLPFNPGVTLKSGSLLAMMAHALPIVATRATPPDPDLENDRLLRLVSPRNVEQLAAQISQLLANRDLRHQLGVAAYRFSRQFSWSSIGETHRSVYQTALQKLTSASHSAV